VAQQLREVEVNIDVRHLMLLLQFGTVSRNLCRYNNSVPLKPGSRMSRIEWVTGVGGSSRCG
jgi:hypothetical protein